MCEVQRGIKKLKLKLPAPETMQIVMDNPHYKSRSNQMTDMILQDKGVLAMYKTFLHEWMRIIRAIRQPARCAPVKNQTIKQIGMEEHASRHAYSSLRQVTKHRVQPAIRHSAYQGGVKNHIKRAKNPQLDLTNIAHVRKQRKWARMRRQRKKPFAKKCKWGM